MATRNRTEEKIFSDKRNFFIFRLAGMQTVLQQYIRSLEILEDEKLQLTTALNAISRVRINARANYKAAQRKTRKKETK